MSFHVNIMGKPDALKRRLKQISETEIGADKQEFDAVWPAIAMILERQLGNGIIHVEASGHSSAENGSITWSSCAVSVRALGINLAE